MPISSWKKKPVFKEKGWQRSQRDGKKHTDNMVLWALQAFPLSIKDKKIWDSSLQYIERQQIHLCKGLLLSDFCLHNCKELNWQDCSHSLYFEMQICFAFCKTQDPEIRPQSLGVLRTVTQEEHLTAAVAVFKCFHKIRF